MNTKKLVSLILSVFLLALTFSFAPFSYSADAADEQSYIDWFIPGTTVDNAKAVSGAILSVSVSGVSRGGSESVATGDTVTTANGSYIAVVRGDITGSGEISTVGYLMMKRHALGTFSFNALQLKAADVDKNGSFSSLDYLMAKRAFLGTYSFPVLANASSVPVLLYHHILPDAVREQYWSSNSITIATSEFRRDMQLISDNGCTPVTAAELVAYVRGEILLPQGAVCLCFDDGYKSNTEYAAPILSEFGFNATVFSIMSLYEGEYEATYNNTALQHIKEYDLNRYPGVFVQQCHTWSNHNHLDEQTYSQIYADLMLSQNSHFYDFFAYPYGDYNSEVIRAVTDAGFKAAFTTSPVNAIPGNSVYEIPRITIETPMTQAAFLAILLG